MSGVLELMPELGELPPFRPRWPWVGGDLQTLRNWVVRTLSPLRSWPEQTLALPMNDGTGDRLVGFLHQPAKPASCPRPLVILIHGLTGSSESSYIRASAGHLLKAGFPILRLNLRGAGPSAGHTKHLYHAGRSEDLHRAIQGLDGRLMAHGVVMIGYSLGGALVLKYLAEHGFMTPLMASVSVSAPIDLDATQRRLAMPRNAIYHRHLLMEMKRGHGGPIGPEIRSIIDFDNHIVAPENGFRDAEDYYRQCSTAPLLGRIRRPSLIIHACDDPWIPIENYRDVDWAGNPYLMPLVPPSGGHVGFHAGDMTSTWHDAAILKFLTSLGQ